MYKTVEKILLKYDPELNNLLQALKDISADFDYISKINAQKVADYFSVPLSKVFETASFYDLIKTEKNPSVLIKVCSGTSCTISESFQIIREVENYFGIKAGDEFHAYRQAGNPKIRLEIISCLGRCGEGPIMVINNKVYEKVTVSRVHTILAEYI